MREIIYGRLVVVLFIVCVGATGADDDRPCASSCGEIRNISSPFRLETDPLHCGNIKYSLSCESNATVLYYLANVYPSTDPPKKYFVAAINYNNYTIRVVDPDIQRGNCSTVPAYTLSPPPAYYIGYWDAYTYEMQITVRESQGSSTDFRVISPTVIFFTCEKPMNSSKYFGSPCLFNGRCAFKSERKLYSYYYLMDAAFSSSDLDKSCCVEQISHVSAEAMRYSHDFYDAIKHGFELSWLQSFDKSGDGSCYYKDSNLTSFSCSSHCSYKYFGVSFPCITVFNFLEHLRFYLSIEGRYKYVVIGILTPRTLAGLVFLIGFLIYKWRRRNLSIYEDIEKFLQSHNNLAPIRYSYSEIKKMTKGFKESLGEGGFGSVYKGKLRSGHLVAVKLLTNKSKGTPNWQDFINEVATIGRIHHINVAQLIGFCVEGSKRALVFDFMSNGSLEKFIFSGEETSSLSCDKIFQIALGVARGIEYLHSGCDMQILHFDIKPHNILLDDNFVAKISDFGLARLCSLDESIVSLTAVRGTIGYIAPELFYKNIGGVSHKADVYSFGMLLMEMANRRKNTNVESEDSDGHSYFPLWIHEQFSNGKGMRTIEGATEIEVKTVEKMMIVALWCIQMKPSDRPSMDRVIEMLEGGFEGLTMPPKPCFYPQESDAVEGVSGDTSDATSTFSSLALSTEQNSMEISLIKSFNSQVQNS